MEARTAEIREPVKGAGVPKETPEVNNLDALLARVQAGGRESLADTSTQSAALRHSHSSSKNPTVERVHRPGVSQGGQAAVKLRYEAVGVD